MAETDEDRQQDSPSIGERLKNAREAKSLSLDEVANRTRIPIRHLRNMEEDNWDALPAVTYSVGFARSYANEIGLDGSAIGAELRERLGSPRPVVSSPEFYEAADPARVPPRSLALIAAVLAILLVGGYLVWRSGIGDGTPEPRPAREADVAVQAPEKAMPPQARPLTPETVAGQPVALVATDEVWLRVDGEGSASALFQGILQAGERYEVPASARQPMLRTGRPQVLRVMIGGRDLGPLEPVERTVSDVSLASEDLAARLGGAGQGGAPPPAAPPPVG